MADRHSQAMGLVGKFLFLEGERGFSNGGTIISSMANVSNGCRRRIAADEKPLPKTWDSLGIISHSLSIRVRRDC